MHNNVMNCFYFYIYTYIYIYIPVYIVRKKNDIIQMLETFYRPSSMTDFGAVSLCLNTIDFAGNF